MPLGYKYVERDAQETQINWAEVGANFSGMLQEENRVREEQKAAFDEQARDIQNTLNAVPQGQNTRLNEAALNFSADLQEQALMLNKLLKTGALKPRDYTIQMQNLMDGTSQGFGLLDEYNQEYASKMAKQEAGILSQVDLDIMANVESFANFQEHRFLINPETGVVSIGKMIEGPGGTLVADSNPNNLATVSSLRNRIKQTVNKFDVMGVSQQRANSLGTDERTIIESMGDAYKRGIFRQVSDIRQRESSEGKTDEELAKELGIKTEDFKSISLFNESQDKWAKSQVSSAVNSMAGASTLIDFMGFTEDGNQYTTTFDPKGVFNEDGSRNESVILLENKNGRVISSLTDAQQANAERALKVQSEMMIKTKEVIKPTITQAPRPRPRTTRDTRDTRDRGGVSGKELFGFYEKLYSGNDKEVSQAEKQVRGLNPNIIGINRDDSGVVVTIKEDGEVRREPFPFAEAQNEGEWIIGISNFLTNERTADVDKALKLSGFEFNKVPSVIGRAIISKRRSASDAVADFVRAGDASGLSSDLFYSKTNTDVIPSINDFLQMFGAKVGDRDTLIGNDITIVSEVGKEKEFNTNADSEEEAISMRNDILKFITSNQGLTVEGKEEAFLSGAFDVGGGEKELD
jgi:hypothetical protein